ncbi:hypothetical protein BG015_003578 [Linnemannia schmuckeri]|uniref:F-box domain-containing protein n=1 Tax=Linnemannia schmuckeri TaxID=64567 RepID=A0A9P5VFB8_9FUNG|nr:hypothetical protein BG015_003578 [Linnemannia schmuckeri]
MSNSNTQISIFDIPHILDLICDDLSKDQLLTCLEVSRTWRANFTPQALRHIRFSNLKGHQTWTILHSVGLIRSLTIDISDAGWFLNNNNSVTATCSNLRELRCVDFNYQPKPAAGAYYYTRPSIVDQSDNALRLIEACPKLETLIVDNLSHHYRTDHFTEDVFKSIYTSTSLTAIKIHLKCVPREFWSVLAKSLPVGLKDFEASVKRWFPSVREVNWFTVTFEGIYPRNGYPWHQRQQQQEDRESEVLFSGARPLPSLERLALGKRRLRQATTASTIPAMTIIDQVVPNPENSTKSPCYTWSKVTIEIVQSCVERSSGLRHLVLNGYYGPWPTLLQLLLDNCLNLEIMDLSGFQYGHSVYNYPPSSSATQVLGSFAVLKEVRISNVSLWVYKVVAEVLVRSAATLETVWIEYKNWEQVKGGANPFHIGTTASWTQCMRLRELGIYRHGGSLMTDYRWDINPPFSVEEPIKDYSTVFGRLEKLRLAVRETLWGQCPDRSYIELDYGSWYDEEEDALCDDSDLDEQDDEDWKPLKTVTQTEEEINRECQRQRTKRNHGRAFILQVRELFGRLKDLKQLRELEIEWTVCYSLSKMPLEDALELFRETEGNDTNNNSNNNATNGDASPDTKTSRGWWGAVAEDDLVWLCLPWYSQPAPQPSRVPSNIIKAAALQYENKTPLSISCDDSRYHHHTCTNKRSPWSTGDIYNQRTGRTWKDWQKLTSEHHASFTKRPEFEVFVKGVSGAGEEAGWGRKKATKGENGRYRQKVAGKMNQRK